MVGQLNFECKYENDKSFIGHLYDWFIDRL